jgi:membrane protease YdiL (CAAX protease family)
MSQGTSPTSLQASTTGSTGSVWRSGLRVLLWFAVLYIVIWITRLIMGVAPNLLMRWLGASPDFRAYIGSTLNYGVGIAAYILLPALALKRILGIDPRSALFPKHKGWWKDLLYGFLLITIILTLFFVVEVRAGWLIIDAWTWQNLGTAAWFRTAWVGLLVNAGVAIGEETVFRGYLLTGLKNVWGRWFALGAMTVIFGLFHLPAYIEGGIQSATLTLAILLASLFGLLFGLIYLRTGSLWLPVALHFTWNFVENDLLNLSADPTNQNLIGALTRLRPPLTMSGFGWGNVIVLETLALVLIALGIWLWLRNRQGVKASLST